MSTVTVSLADHATARISAEESVIADLADALAFEAPGASFDPRVRKGQWDGMIRLMKKREQTIPAGLYGRVAEYCSENDLTFEDLTGIGGPSLTEAEAHRHLDTYGIPEKFDRRDYQVSAFRKAIESTRQLFVSPTSSGKSMIIYTLIRYYKKKTLIIVPTVGLVGQMIGDFTDYGYEGTMHPIQEGREDIEADVVVATWQSIYELPAKWFDQFGLVIGDEAHLFSAESLTGIMMKMRRCPLRFGFTGTLKGSKVHQLQLEGLFGPSTVVTTTRELMDRGYVAQLDVQCVVLKHPPVARKVVNAMVEKTMAEAKKKRKKLFRGAVQYQKEIQFLYACEPRNRFIVKMASRLKGNVLILFHHVEHGQKLYDMLVSETTRPIHLIDGGVDGLERNEIRAIIDSSDDNILVASVGTSSTGMSIRRINHLIMASPWKSRIVVLQSTGRGLRMADDKDSVVLYDLGDDLTAGSGTKNHTLKHLGERVGIYASEQFDYRVSPVELPY